MQALKALVILMGILIVAGIAVIGFTIANRLATPPAGAPDFGERALGLPAGTTILSATPGDGRLILLVRLPDGANRVVIVDPATGRRLGTLSP
ncbi:MAG: DUF6476 family protein [Alphaproteobacteria bacterium]